MQYTISKPVTVSGIGVHSGCKVSLTISPAPSDTGIVFIRSDIAVGKNELKARYDNVVDTRLNTQLGDGDRLRVGTIEHLMAAFAGFGIDNLRITIDGPEVPILDGSSLPFAKAILDVGRIAQDSPKRVIKILKPIVVEHNEARASFEPADKFMMHFSIDFEDSVIGQQSQTLNMGNGSFLRELANCRTFCRLAEVNVLQENGLALGGGLENAVIVDGDRVLNPEGFRRADECVRHKMLDALGDLYLAGAPILGYYKSHRGGHHVTNMLLRALFATPDAWVWVDCDDSLVKRLPGSDLTATDLAAVDAA